MTNFDSDRSWARAKTEHDEQWSGELLDEDGRPKADYWSKAKRAAVLLEEQIYALDRVEAFMAQLISNGEDAGMQQLLVDETDELLNEARWAHRGAVVQRMRADELLGDIPQPAAVERQETLVYKRKGLITYIEG